MNGLQYEQLVTLALSSRLGSPRKTAHGLRFGDISVEFEHHGPMIIVFLATLNWQRYASWDGAVHIDTRVDSVDASVSAIAKLMDVGRKRIAK